MDLFTELNIETGIYYTTMSGDVNADEIEEHYSDWFRKVNSKVIFEFVDSYHLFNQTLNSEDIQQFGTMMARLYEKFGIELKYTAMYINNSSPLNFLPATLYRDQFAPLNAKFQIFENKELGIAFLEFHKEYQFDP